MVPTPSRPIQSAVTHLRTPQAKHRLQFNGAKTPNPSPIPASIAPAEHPVEVVGRIRDHPDRKEKPISVLQVNPDGKTFRVRADVGYRDFTLDGISLSEEEGLDSFYRRFIQARIDGVKVGDKCTIMMYGPTGSGKSHTMFGCSKQPGIVYRTLKDILGERDEDGPAMFVQVTVLEIYNEEIYDLLSTNGGGGFSLGWPKGGSASKVRLEVMGKKAKNATFISGTEAGKISKEIQKVEKRRIVKSTLCNERSSRSHCLIILDVPTVGGRLMLVDMAGSENIEQAGQTGFEAKMQTAKINQGNTALKRVVESIANGDSHVPFRDSKLTMLLQDSFEDDKSKILMILCASPDPKEIHKTISTLEYGAKAKCIVRGPHTPIKDKTDESSGLLGSRIVAMDQFICKLQTENKLREKECDEARKELSKKEQEVAALRSKLQFVEVKGSGASEEEINLKVNEQTRILKLELEKKLEECQRMANEFVELERRRMEERIQQQQQEVEMLRRRLEEIESELSRSRGGNDDQRSSMEGSRFAKRLLGMYGDEDPGMVKSMDLDMGDQETFSHDVKQATVFTTHQPDNSYGQGRLGSNDNSYGQGRLGSNELADHDDVLTTKFGLSTVFEEEEDEQKEDLDDEVVNKEIIQEKRMVGGSSSPVTLAASALNYELAPNPSSKTPGKENDFSEREALLASLRNEPENGKESASSRRVRIQNIFTLCGNHRELSQHVGTPVPAKRRSEPGMMPVGGASLSKSLNKVSVEPFDEILMTPSSKENYNPSDDCSETQIEVYVKWEATKENPGKFITTLKVVREASLADLRKLIEIYLGADNQAFTFLILGDPSGAPVQKEKEGSVQATKLPIYNNQVKGYLACLQPAKGMMQCANQTPLSPLENKMPLTPIPSLMQKSSAGLSPQMAQHLNSTPLLITQRRR